MSVGLSDDDVKPYLDQVSSQFGYRDVMVGCINSPKNVTVTGDEAQVNLLKSLLEKNLIFVRKLQVDVAYHSPHMDDIATEYLRSIKDLQRGDFTVDISTMISTVTGQMLSLDNMQESGYWVKNMTSPVRFSDALMLIEPAAGKTSTKAPWTIAGKVLLDDLLEIGPHSTLKGPIREHLIAYDIKNINYSSILLRSVSAIDTLLNVVGGLHCAGYEIDICKINRFGKMANHGEMVLPNLPEYPFDHSRSYWHESRFTKQGWRLRKYPRLDLLGSPVSDWNPLHPTWRNIIRLSETPWVQDHKVWTPALLVWRSLTCW